MEKFKIHGTDSMIIPPRVKVGAVWYEVRLLEDWNDSEGTDGQCFYEKPIGNAIYIRSTLTREAQEATFVHECLHAMNSTIDHTFLDSFAEQIYTWLVDNRLIYEK